MLLDMFDKLDDIIYKPVETICEWTKEPLRRWEHKRNMESKGQEIEAAENEKASEREHEKILAQMAADNEASKMRLEQELTEQERASVTADYEARERIAADVRRWNAEIDEMIYANEDARRDRLVESFKKYQIDLAKASVEIANSIGIMSIELREKTHALVIEKTKEYIKIQREAEEHAENRLEEIGKKFANNERVRIKMEDSVIDNMNDIINNAGTFITGLSKDIEHLNQNIDAIMNTATGNSNQFLSPMSEGLGVTIGTSFADDTKRIQG